MSAALSPAGPPPTTSTSNCIESPFRFQTAGKSAKRLAELQDHVINTFAVHAVPAFECRNAKSLAKLAKLSFAKGTSHPDTLISCSQAALD
jgi:hypothetical protein